jgi:citrate synthase
MSTASAKARDGFLTRREALDVLAVKPATLYTYVSRGLIRRLPMPGKKESLYYREDIERARTRSDARAAEGVVAAAAVRYGEPIVPTSITEITADGPRYRGRAAVELADRGVSFEAVAELLWTGLLMEDTAWGCEPLPRDLVNLAQDLTSRKNANIHDAFAMLTSMTGMARGAPDERIAKMASDVLAARQLLYTLTGCFAMLGKGRRYRTPRGGETVVEALAGSLAVDSTPKVLHALNAALTLSADHELNPATFVARIAASSEADLHSCIAAAISTNSGTRIARGCDRLEAVLRDPSSSARIVQRLRHGRSGSDIATWGFSHPLYPAGDPRGRRLLAIVRELPAPSVHLRQLLRQVEIVERDFKLQPRLETALVLLSVALRLPKGTAAGLYTLGRLVGWVAHIAEQRLAGYLIRPRAKFGAYTSM